MFLKLTPRLLLPLHTLQVVSNWGRPNAVDLSVFRGIAVIAGVQISWTE
jgi:hypothetical protein